MKSINDIINESKTIDSGLLEFKDGSDSVVSMIVKRMEIWDGNKTPTSRLPMFLVSENHEAIRWVQKKYLTTPKDSGETVETYDGYLKEYLMKKNTPNDCYILGVFVDRCFIPIINQETYNNILERIQ